MSTIAAEVIEEDVRCDGCNIRAPLGKPIPYGSRELFSVYTPIPAPSLSPGQWVAFADLSAWTYGAVKLGRCDSDGKSYQLLEKRFCPDCAAKFEATFKSMLKGAP